ncbi:ATP-binding protein [Azohydromonas aeria]|uniref:ATP-binding protein n=1 Tax=Azohydromonas aeria TaxID=2590212 RepID=UPI0012F91C50|nr:ATP-binding protein [Azohydromonas aeria]
MSPSLTSNTAPRAVAPGWPADDGPMAALIRAHDWAATPLGPPASWPASLRLAVDTCLGCGFASLVCWGPELVQLYNDAAQRILGAGLAPALGRPARQAWGPAWARVGPLAEQVLRSGKPVLGEDVPLLLQRGSALETAYLTFSLGALRDESGAVAGVCATVLETTVKVRAVAARRESEARIHAIADLVPDLLWSDDAGGHSDWVNRRWLDYTGCSEGDSLGQGWHASIHPEDLPALLARRRGALQQGAAWESEHRIRRFDGDFRWHLLRAEPLRDAAGHIVQWLGSATDIHEQRLSRELLEQRVAERTQALRQLLLRVESVQDEERRRIARELHDSLGQYLASLLLAVGVLKAELADAEARRRLEALEAQLQRVDRELDRLVFVLRPTALEDCGLGEGVEAYVQTWSDLTGVAVDLELQGLDRMRLPVQMQAAAFRVVQESLTNVAKYAQASQVSVSLARRGRQLVGSVEDDGVGFDATDATVPAPNRVNWGLLGMQERIEALGGSFAVESQPGTGTTVLWRVPLRPAAAGAPPPVTSPPAGDGGAAPRDIRPGAEHGQHGLDAHHGDWGQSARPLAQMLLGRLAEAEEAVRARDDFLAIVGHQLRSPMNALSLQLHAAERWLGQGDGARATDGLQRARRILRRFVQRATVLLDVSRLNTGQFRLDIAPVDVSALVARVLDGCAQDAAFLGAPVRADIEPGLAAHWDAQAVEEVLCNLVGNAIKHGAGGAVEVTAAREGAAHVLLSVADRGPGIDPAQQLRLSERFERVVGVPTMTSGFGIGLWLVGQIVRAHGGTVDVAVGPRGGSSFRVKLPVSAIPARS